MAGARPTVLGPDDLNEADALILEELADGRVTPRLVAERRDLNRSYVSQRLIRLAEHGHVETITRGLYELVEDPRTTDE